MPHNLEHVQYLTKSKVKFRVKLYTRKLQYQHLKQVLKLQNSLCKFTTCTHKVKIQLGFGRKLKKSIIHLFSMIIENIS